MANPILVTGAAGRVGAVGRTVTELLLKQGKAVRAMVRTEYERAQALRNIVALLSEAGAEPSHLVRLTWFVTSRDEYSAARKAIGDSGDVFLSRTSARASACSWRSSTRTPCPA